jgi:hypothetical protein
VSVTFDLRNPIFNDIGSFSYPFNLPNTPKNRALLGFPDKINYGGSTPKSQQADIYIDGMIWKRGIIVVRDANEKHIRVNFGVGEGYFFNLIKDLKLNEVDLGGARSIQDYVTIHEYNGTSYIKYFDSIVGKLFPETDFNLFPFYTPNFHKEKSFYQTWLNQTGGTINKWIQNSPIPGFNGFQNSGYKTFVPFPFINYIINQIAAQLNFTIEINSFYNDPFLRQLVLFKLYSISENIGNEQIGDHFQVSQTFNLADGLPDISLSEFFQKVTSIFNAYVFFDDQQNSMKLVTFKNILNGIPIEFDSLSFKQKTINPNDYDGFEMNYELDSSDDFLEEHFKEISQFNYKGSVPTFIELPLTTEENDLYFIEVVRSYYYWVAPRTYGSNTYFGEWRFYSHDFLRTSEGNGKLKINIPGVFSRIQNSPVAQAGNEGQMQIINERFFKPEGADFRLLFYYGTNNGVPHGGAFRSDVFPYSLEWSGPYGLKENFYKEWLHFNATTRAAEYTMPLSAARLKQIDFSKKYRWDQTNWLIDTIRFTVTNNKISPAKVTVKKCK